MAEQKIENKQVKRRKRKYNWGLIAELYVRHNYTTSDLHLIFGPVTGHIQKQLEGAGVPMRKSGRFTIPHTPKMFSKELNQKIRQEPGLEERLEKYYKNVITFKALSKVRQLLEEGYSHQNVSDYLGKQISKSTVGRWAKVLPDKSSKELYLMMRKNRAVFERNLEESKRKRQEMLKQQQ